MNTSELVREIMLSDDPVKEACNVIGIAVAVISDQASQAGAIQILRAMAGELSAISKATGAHHD